MPLDGEADFLFNSVASMETMKLSAIPRTAKGRKNYALRVNEQVPGVVYGSEIEPMTISVVAGDFMRTYRNAGESTIIDLDIEGAKSLKVLIQDIQRDPLRGDVTHIDFRQINMNKEIEAKIQLKFIGESAAVKGMGGTLVKAMEEIEVRCLPAALIHEIEVDISPLATFDDSIQVKDLHMPEGMKLLADPDQTVAVIEAPRSEEELAALDQAVVEDVTKIEVEKKGKEEEEGEAAEGATEEKKADKKPEEKKG